MLLSREVVLVSEVLTFCVLSHSMRHCCNISSLWSLLKLMGGNSTLGELTSVGSTEF